MIFHFCPSPQLFYPSLISHLFTFSKVYLFSLALQLWFVKSLLSFSFSVTHTYSPSVCVAQRTEKKGLNGHKMNMFMFITGMKTGQRTGGRATSTVWHKQDLLTWNGLRPNSFAPEFVSPQSHLITHMDWDQIHSPMNLFFFYSHLVLNSPNFEENEPRNNARSKCLVTDWFSEESQVTRQTLADRKGMSATGKYKSILVVKNS